MSTNDIFDALLALAASITWEGGQTFAETDRRLKLWDKAPAPSLYQVEPDEDIRSQDGQLDRETLNVKWVIYHRAGKDQSTTPSRTTSDILDAVKAAIRPTLPGALQTLGGRVHRTFISGKIIKAEGDLDGQTMIVVPISIIVP
jgi:hypothetical protein